MDSESQTALAAATGWNVSDVWHQFATSGGTPGPTANGTQDINSFYFYETEQFTLLWVLFSLIVVGNSAVIAALALSKNRKSRMKFFIMHLALADLCVGLISVGTDIAWRISVEWNAGNAACKLIKFLQCVVTYSSTYVLVALSIDRCDAITHPMNFSGSSRRARLLVAAAWALSVLFSLPIIVFYEEKRIQGRLQCWIEFEDQWQWQLYMCLVSFALFLAPAVIISACYTVIVLTIWSKSRTLVPPKRLQNGVLSGDPDADSRRASSRGIIPRAKIKTVKMTFGIVFVFILCWSPYILFDLLQVFGFVPETQTNIALASFVQSLAPLNSAANPLIYCVFSTEICRSIRRAPRWRGSAAAQATGVAARPAHWTADPREAAASDISTTRQTRPASRTLSPIPCPRWPPSSSASSSTIWSTRQSEPNRVPLLHGAIEPRPRSTGKAIVLRPSELLPVTRSLCLEAERSCRQNTSYRISHTA